MGRAGARLSSAARAPVHPAVPSRLRRHRARARNQAAGCRLRLRSGRDPGRRARRHRHRAGRRRGARRPGPPAPPPGRLPGRRAGGAAVPCPLVHGGDLVQRRPVRRQPHRRPGRGATGRHPGRLGGDQCLRPTPRLRDARGVRGPTAAAATPTPGAPAARSGCRSRAGWRRWFNRPGSPRSTRPRWPARSTIPTARRLGGRCPQRGRSWPPSEAPAGRGCGRRSRPRWPLPDQRWRCGWSTASGTCWPGPEATAAAALLNWS
jgi:hypothetical protein